MLSPVFALRRLPRASYRAAQEGATSRAAGSNLRARPPLLDRRSSALGGANLRFEGEVGREAQLLRPACPRRRPDGDAAILAWNALASASATRALSANSPFCGESDTILGSTPSVFESFPDRDSPGRPLLEYSEPIETSLLGSIPDTRGVDARPHINSVPRAALTDFDLLLLHGGPRRARPVPGSQRRSGGIAPMDPCTPGEKGAPCVRGTPDFRLRAVREARLLRCPRVVESAADSQTSLRGELFVRSPELVRNGRHRGPSQDAAKGVDYRSKTRAD